MSASIPVFCYHNVSAADGFPAERFAEHLTAIRDAGFTTIPARLLVAGMRGEARLPKRACVLTFDDCHITNWTTAAPLLAKFGMTAVFFCVTDFLTDGEKRPQDGDPSPGPAAAGAPESFRRALCGDFSQFMNRAELAGLIEDYGFEVHGHAARHQGCFRTMRRIARLADPQAHWSAWGIYPPEMLRAEFAGDLPLFETGSAYVYNGFWPVPGGPEAGGGLFFRRRTDAERRAMCRAEFGRCIATMRGVNGLEDQYFCWPWGIADPLAEACVREAGFCAAFILSRSANAAGGDVMRIHRIGVGKIKDGAWVERRLRMYSGRVSARVCFKFVRKRPELKSVVYMTDSDKLSGGSRQMVNAVLGMRASGLRVTVVVPPGSAIRSALAPLEKGENPVGIVEYAGFRHAIPAAGFVARLARRVGADVIHTYHSRAYKAAALARLLGGRFRLFINRGVIFPPNLLFGLYSLAAEGVTANSLACAATLRRFGVPKSRLRLVYNSFLPGPEGLPPERPARKKRGCRVLYVGNDAPAKGFDVFLAVADDLVRRGVRDLEFAAVGVVKLASFAGRISSGVKNRLRSTGELPHAGVLRELAEADVLVLPSRLESLPNALLEGFACSLPAVVTRVGGMPELVRDGINGFVRESGDAAGLAQAVERLAADPPLRRRMGRINRRIVADCLDNAGRTLTLLRIYCGERLFAPLPIEELARRIAAEKAAPCAPRP